MGGQMQGTYPHSSTEQNFRKLNVDDTNHQIKLENIFDTLEKQVLQYINYSSQTSNHISINQLKTFFYHAKKAGSNARP